jgi:hypothetical protein
MNKSYQENLDSAKRLGGRAAAGNMPEIPGFFTQPTNDKLRNPNNPFELRETELVVKAFVGTQSGEIELLTAGNLVEGYIDFDQGKRLNPGRIFLINHIDVQVGHGAAADVDPSKVEFGVETDKAVNEAILEIKSDDKLAVRRSVRKITKGLAAKDHKLSQPGLTLGMITPLKDGAEQSIKIITPKGMVIANPTDKKVAVMVVLSGYEILT